MSMRKLTSLQGEAEEILQQSGGKFDPANQCKNKQGYKKYETAAGVVYRMIVSGAKKTKNLRAYKCPHCGKYHVGNEYRPKEKRHGKH